MDYKYKIRRFKDDNALTEWLNAGKVKEENIVMILPYYEPGGESLSYSVIYRKRGI